MTTTSSAVSLQTKAAPWWLSLIGGFLAILVGGMLLVSPAKTTVVLVQLIGIYWLISGIFQIIYMFVDHTAWGWKLFIGIVGIIAGGAILQYPLASAYVLPTVFVLVIGIYGLIAGIVMLIQAFRGAGWGAGILGALAILFGLILVANYYTLASVVSLIWVTAIAGLIGGVLLIIQAFRLRSV